MLGSAIQIPYALGQILIGVVALMIRDYVTLQWVMSLLCCLQLPILLLVPESPRWLLSKGRMTEAREVMRKAAQWNNKTVCLTELRQVSSQTAGEAVELGFADLFSSRDILLITVVMTLNWPIVTMGFFGLAFSSTHLGGNIFLDFILGACVEV